MFLRGRPMKPSTVSRMIVRVDVYTEEEMQGRLYSPYIRKGTAFYDFWDLARKMDRIFDLIDHPRANTEYRRLPGGEPPAEEGPIDALLDDTHMEEDASIPGLFIVHVQTRRNADWQGVFSRPDQPDKPHRFKSTLELLKLLDRHLK